MRLMLSRAVTWRNGRANAPVPPTTFPQAGKDNKKPDMRQPPQRPLHAAQQGFPATTPATLGIDLRGPAVPKTELGGP
jgi:hypothetical protein